MTHVNPQQSAPRLPIRNLRDIAAIEAVPLADRIESWDVAEWLWKGCAIDPQKPALQALEIGDIDADPHVITYEQLRRRSIQVANALHGLGVGKGDAVVCLLPNVTEFYPITLGAIAAGIMCPLNWMMNQDQIADLICTVAPPVVLALGPTPQFDIWEKLEAIRHRLPARTRILSVRGMRDTRAAADDFELALERAPDGALTFQHVRGADEVAAYIHSGGTTGSPKLVKLTHRGFVYKFWSLSNLLGYGPDDVIFADYPFFHCAGFLNRAVASVALGMSIVIPSAIGARDKAFIRNYWKFVERFRITQLSGVPTTLSLLAKALPQGEDLRSLRPFATTGSQPLPVEIAKRIESELGIRLLLTYGATEYTTTLTQTPVLAESRHGSTGFRLPYTDIKVVELDAAGNIRRECGTNEIGVVVAKGPGITPGYLIAEQNQGLFTSEGWINSGDLGRIDHEGYLWLTGRAKDLIIRGGHNIDPSKIEEALLQNPSVLHAAAIGKPDGYAGELPVAYVQLADGARLTESDLKTFVAERIHERAAVPVDIFIVEEIPLSDVRKPLKVELRRDAARRTFTKLLREAVPGEFDLDVNVRPDSEHGNLVVIRAAGKPTAGVEQAIGETMKPFSMPYRLEWSAPRPAP